MDRGFSAVHPFVCFAYYVIIVVFAMILYHPVYLALTLISLIIWILMHDGGRNLSKSWPFYLISGIVILFINPLINHRGENVIFYIYDWPITLEAVVYGLTMMLSLLVILLAFVCYQQVVDNHKFLYLFSSFLPKTAFLVMMSMRFVPLLLMRMKQISVVQKTRGLDMTDGTVRKRVRDGMQILQILITWSFEGALQTADSMKARGYGVTKRSSYSDYRMCSGDWLLLAAIIVLAAVTAVGCYFGYGKMTIYPSLGTIRTDVTSMAFYLVFCILLFIPIFIEEREILIWR